MHWPGLAMIRLLLLIPCKARRLSGKTRGICISLLQASDTTGLKKEGFTITSDGNLIRVVGNDGTGVIYGCREIIDRLEANEGQFRFAGYLYRCARDGSSGWLCRYTEDGVSARTWCIRVSLYAGGIFLGFYDKAQWIDYLDMLVENRMNSLYLWNGHPFASLVRLKDYPFAVEVDDETFKKNEDMFLFLTTEAEKRGIFCYSDVL